MSGTKVIAIAEAENKGGVYQTDIRVHQHEFLVDEPVDLGGQDRAPSPGDYVCAALASCKAITLRMYAQRKGWQVDLIRVNVKLVKADDINTNTFFCTLELEGDLTEEQKERMLAISKACPIQKLLERPAEVVTVENLK
ncbi:OsmC family protein [Pedobacter sp. SYSU D00535]|uniref:OsmC family protein n=1 Tax=Pedobacter sp. SYSU D00535 TaxID=2810308 RepID=UPI001A96D24E|nr:OsmC family protein [Pedobacter sp. SYSU D00535]